MHDCAILGEGVCLKRKYFGILYKVSNEYYTAAMETFILSNLSAGTLYIVLRKLHAFETRPAFELYYASYIE